MANQATGLGSGLDIEGLVTQLVAAERSPIESKFSCQASATATYRTRYVKSALADLKSASDKVKSPGTFESASRRVDSAKVSATASSSAAIGSMILRLPA